MILFIIFVSIFFLLGFSVFGYEIYAYTKGRAAARLPSATGTITECGVKDVSDEDGNNWQVHASYTYAVDGVQYMGKRIAFGYFGSSNQDAQQQLSKKLQESETIPIRYNPAKKSESVLLPGPSPSVYMVLFFASLWLLAVFGFTTAVLVASAHSSANGIDVELQDKP